MMSVEIQLVCLLGVVSLLFQLRIAESPDAITGLPESGGHHGDALREIHVVRHELEKLHKELHHLKQQFVKSKEEKQQPMTRCSVIPTPDTEGLQVLRADLNAERLKRLELETELHYFKNATDLCEKKNKEPVTKCESGFLTSGYCYTESCFNQEKTAHFRLKFVEPPSVTYGFAYLDQLGSENTRVSTTQPVVTETYLRIRFNTWAGSVCYQLTLSWMACGSANP